MEIVENWIKPLEIAFMGYNSQITEIAFRQFARDNAEKIEEYRRTWRDRIKLKDGTRITKISPGEVYQRLDGYRFDQLILADDSRQRIHSTRWREISLLLCTTMEYSCVPEKYKILFYDLDAPEPGDGDQERSGRHGHTL